MIFFLNRDFLLKNKKSIFKIVLGVSIFSAALITYLGNTAEEPVIMPEPETLQDSTELTGSALLKDEISPEKKSIIVDVGGAVASPAVVTLKEGGRVYEAIELAGGLSENADTSEVNMAAFLRDGDKLYIPTMKEAILKDKPVGIVTEKSKGIIPANGSSQNDGQMPMINLNTATKEELQRLKGVGPSTADKIIEYRDTYGAYKKIEDLMNVSGIGEKTFEKLKQNITV